MKRAFLAVMVAASVPGIYAYAAGSAPVDMEARSATSRAAATELQTRLGGELKAAMTNGGPAAAIQVCNQRAAVIAQEVSQKNGFTVGRTSLKNRSTQNAPDVWERGVMDRFEARRAAGEDLAKIEHAEVVTVNGKRVFRYMKPIPTVELCVNCHGGAEVKPDVEAALKTLYPSDRARGFKPGDIRGAFTVSQPL